MSTHTAALCGPYGFPGTPASSNAFILPQWGGIVIYNPPSNEDSHTHLTLSELDRTFSAFATQLQMLLGVSRLPAGVDVQAIEASSEVPLTPWQLDALLRRRALENAQSARDTLLSTVKLVNQIESMPVDQFVRDDVQDALSALEKVSVIYPLKLFKTLY